MNVQVTQQRRGKNLQLIFVVTFQHTSSNYRLSNVFNIDDLVDTRFKYENASYSNVNILLSLKKHASAKDSTVKVNVKSEVLGYSQQWTCTEHWIYWQKMGVNKDRIDISNSDYVLCVFPINITVIEEKSFTANSIFEDSDWTDFLLSAPDGSVAVHKACLAAHSEVFQTMLSQEWKETTEGCIQIEGVTLQTLKHLKQYMYLNTLPDDGLRPLLLIARCYLMDNLKSECISKLARTATSENLEDLLNFAIDNKITELALAMLQLTPDNVVHGAYQLKKTVELTSEQNKEE